MRISNAKVTDILRTHQRDEAFINELNIQVNAVLKVAVGWNNSWYHKLKNYADLFTNLWYYSLTSGCNLQTLGEEYTGIIRVCNGNKLPSLWMKIVWLSLYMGGEVMFVALLKEMRKQCLQMQTLPVEAKIKFLEIIDFLKDNVHILIRLHQAIFYITGRHYSIANRMSGIKYILLRDWFQGSSSISSFRFLGICYLLYLVAYLARYDYSDSCYEEYLEGTPTMQNNICVLCNENRQNTCATPCGHLFCWECIYKSIKYNPSCPTCRELINPSRIICLQNYS